MLKYILFGAGSTGQAAINYFANEIAAVIDNDVNKQKKLFHGVPVISLEDYKKNHATKTILISIYSKHYYDVIEQLKQNNISNYYTLPPLVYGYPTPDRMAKEIYKSAPQRVYVDRINPISRKICTCLKELTASNPIDIKILEEMKEDENFTDSIVLFTENEIECSDREDYNIPKTNVFDVYEQLHGFPELCEYRGCHMGETCFIVGNGPSLRKEDLEMLKNNSIVSFASNGIYNIYPQTSWRPDYYTIIDLDAIDRFREGIKALHGKQCFVVNANYVDFELEETNRFTAKNYLTLDDEIEFSEEISNYVVCGRTVTYAMLQIACYMGFKKIYLLGVDWTGGKQSGKPRYDFYDLEKPSVDIGAFDMIAQEEIAYKSAKRYADLHDIDIINATRGGELEIFERQDFDTIINQWNKE